MDQLYDPESVEIARTDLSRPEHDTHHLGIQISDVRSAFRAWCIKHYLERELETTVGCIFNTKNQVTYLYCFVITPIGCDAVTRVRGLLGVGGLKFALPSP